MTCLAIGLQSTWAALHYGDVFIAISSVVLAGGLLTLSLIDLDHQKLVLAGVCLRSSILGPTAFSA